MTRIYQPVALTPHTELTLDAAASQHVLKVLRMRVGDELVIFNGKGGEYRATLAAATRHEATIALQDFIDCEREPATAVHLGQCLSRGERMDYAIQKAVEVGVAEITPLFSARSQVRLSDERLKKRLIHWEKVIISACEQSGRTRLPILNPPQQLAEWITQVQGRRYICDFQPGSAATEHAEPVAVLIGPEGGFDSEEVALAHEHEFRSLWLGSLTLRTETAPIVAITLLTIR